MCVKDILLKMLNISHVIFICSEYMEIPSYRNIYLLIIVFYYLETFRRSEVDS